MLIARTLGEMMDACPIETWRDRCYVTGCQAEPAHWHTITSSLASGVTLRDNWAYTCPEHINAGVAAMRAELDQLEQHPWRSGARMILSDETAHMATPALSDKPGPGVVLEVSDTAAQEVLF